MIDIQVELPRNDDGVVITHDIKVPAIPQIGHYMAHDKLGFSGAVNAVDFWWSEADELLIVVRLK